MINNNRGRLDSLIMVGLAVILVSAAMALFIQSNKSKYAFNVHNSLNVIKGNLYIHMNDPTGWGFTVADTTNDPSGINCIRNHSDCGSFASAKNLLIQIRDVGNNIYLQNLTNLTQGLGLDGKGCSTFNAIDGNPGCPIKITITWQPFCPASPCIDPAYLVETTFTYSIPKSYGPQINMSPYNFVLSKP